MQFKPENLTDGQARLYFIDLLESIAIFLVIAYHGTNYEYSFLEDSGNVLFYSCFVQSASYSLYQRIYTNE